MLAPQAALRRLWVVSRLRRAHAPSGGRRARTPGSPGREATNACVARPGVHRGSVLAQPPTLEAPYTRAFTWTTCHPRIGRSAAVTPLSGAWARRSRLPHELPGDVTVPCALGCGWVCHGLAPRHGGTGCVDCVLTSLPGVMDVPNNLCRSRDAPSPRADASLVWPGHLASGEAEPGPCTRGGVTAALRPIAWVSRPPGESADALGLAGGRLREDRAAVDAGPRGARVVASRPCCPVSLRGVRQRVHGPGFAGWSAQRGRRRRDGCSACSYWLQTSH
jgi:hypothetical protein